MNLRFSLSLALLGICINATAQIPGVYEIPGMDKQWTCKKRISGYVAGLETALAADPTNTAAKTELDRINNLSVNLGACDKLAQIPALAQSDLAVEHAAAQLTEQ